jgi:CRP-like cAMP-binding protein
MLQPNQTPFAVGNRLLAALPRRVSDRLLQGREFVTLELEAVVYAPGEPARYAYFPTTAVISTLCAMDNGAMVETNMVGNEGMTGTMMCLNENGSPELAIVQVAGQAIRVGVDAIRQEFDRGGDFHDLVLRYVSAVVAQLSQSVGCNTHHLLEARLSRWLLIVHDRVASDVLMLEQEFLAQMLGTRRSGVTVAAGALRAAGLIRYARGKITILDRKGLEASACECYAEVRAAFERARIGSFVSPGGHS